MIRAGSAFLSYARADGRYRIQEFRDLLAAEVTQQTGAELVINMDDRTEVGQPWGKIINGWINEASLFIAIMSPLYFESSECRRELELFLRRERDLGRHDLVVPIHYREIQQLCETDLPPADRLVAEMVGRQQSDWRRLRHIRLDSEEVCQKLEQLARDMRARLRCDPKSLPAHRPSEPETHIVDRARPNCYQTISDAVAAAQDDDIVLIARGEYGEALRIDKPLQLIGDGPRSEVRLQARDTHVLRLDRTGVRIAG